MGAHKRLLEGRDGDRWTKNARCPRENIREVGVRRERKEKREKRKRRIKKRIYRIEEIEKL